jgi:PAS domain S-box-containing protein
MKDTALEKLRSISEQLMDPELAVRVLEETMDAIVIVRRDATIFWLNKAAEFLFGYHRSELYDKPITDLIPVNLRDQHEEHTLKYMADPHARPMGMGMDLHGVDKVGNTFQAEINLTPIVVPQGFFVVAQVRKTRQ